MSLYWHVVRLHGSQTSDIEVSNDSWLNRCRHNVTGDNVMWYVIFCCKSTTNGDMSWQLQAYTKHPSNRVERMLKRTSNIQLCLLFMSPRQFYFTHTLPMPPPSFTFSITSTVSFVTCNLPFTYSKTVLSLRYPMQQFPVCTILQGQNTFGFTIFQ